MVRRGVSCGAPAQNLVEHLYLEGEGRTFLLFPFTNYFRFSLDDVHGMLTDSSTVWGLGDRGRVAPGYRADLNVIDHAGLEVELPEMRYDLPAGGRNLMQRARGYHATFVAGVQTLADDEPTGALPGRLVRGSRSAG